MQKTLGFDWLIKISCYDFDWLIIVFNHPINFWNTFELTNAFS